jgi:hypothetical protein
MSDRDRFADFIHQDTATVWQDFGFRMGEMMAEMMEKRISDAMLRELGQTNHDAAPAARAQLPAGVHASGRGGTAAGTGDQRKAASTRLSDWQQHGSHAWGLGVAADMLAIERRLAALESRTTSPLLGADEVSPSGSGSGRPINCGAPERQSPAGNRDGGLPLDAGAATSHHAAGGRGHHTSVTGGDMSEKPVTETPKTVHEPFAWAADIPGKYGAAPTLLFGYTKKLVQGHAALGGDAVEPFPLYRSPQTCPYVVGRTTLHCSLTPFTLTYKEREYIICQANRAWHNASEADARGDADWAKWHRDEERTLRSLLERTK